MDSARADADPIEIAVTVASPNVFELLGVSPAQGLGFARNEVGAGRPRVIVLAHELWNKLGADPAIVGTSVRLNGRFLLKSGQVITLYLRRANLDRL